MNSVLCFSFTLEFDFSFFSNGGEEDTSVATDPHPRKKSPRGESNSSRRNSCRVPLPSTLTAMAKPTWLFTSKMIVVHGSIVNEDYSSSNSLDDLREGDTVGVVRKATGDLHFFINGKDLGVAAKNVPAVSFSDLKNLFAEMRKTFYSRNFTFL